MSKISAETVKELRDKTNAGMMDCKKALEESNGDMEKAAEYLRKRGLAIAAKKSTRATDTIVIASYIHNNAKLGSLVEVACETDFVAKNDKFKELVKDITCQVASCAPKYVCREEVPAALVEKEKAFYMDQVKGKPENVIEKIVEGKLDKFFGEICLMEQAFYKDEDKTVNDIVKALIGVMGENVTIKRFVRFEAGE